jgi:hypothetical protein
MLLGLFDCEVDMRPKLVIFDCDGVSGIVLRQLLS